MLKLLLLNNKDLLNHKDMIETAFLTESSH